MAASHLQKTDLADFRSTLYRRKKTVIKYEEGHVQCKRSFHRESVCKVYPPKIRTNDGFIVRQLETLYQEPA